MLAEPHPIGIAIVEIGVNRDGRVVSACVLRGVRSDLDTAAQRAALRSLWTPQLLHGRPVGAVLTISFRFPAASRWTSPRITPRSALPIAQRPVLFVAPEKTCPPGKGTAVRIGGAIVDVPLLDYVEPARPSGIASGSVIVEVTIGVDGRVVEVKPLRGPPGLADPALNAIRKWRFARSCLAGRPIPLIETISLRFGEVGLR